MILDTLPGRRYPECSCVEFFVLNYQDQEEGNTRHTWLKWFYKFKVGFKICQKKSFHKVWEYLQIYIRFFGLHSELAADISPNVKQQTSQRNQENEAGLRFHNIKQVFIFVAIFRTYESTRTWLRSSINLCIFLYSTPFSLGSLDRLAGRHQNSALEMILHNFFKVQSAISGL